MRRTISRLKPLWLLPIFMGVALGVVSIFGAVPSFIGAVPPWLMITVIALGVVLSAVHPKAPEHEPHVLAAPVRGRWAALNTPGQQLPSHGTRFLGQYAAIDILQPTTPETPAKVRRAWRNSKPQEYPSFAEPVYAMADGVVVRTKSRAADHRARNTWQGLAYLMTLEGIIRSLGAPGSLFGNHVLVEHDDGAVAAYAHLRKGSLLVEVGQRVSAGEQLGEIGNSGNSSEPHLHVHLMDRVNPHAAAGLTMTWDNIAESGEIEPSLAEVVKDPAPNAIRTMPRNGEIFHA